MDTVNRFLAIACLVLTVVPAERARACGGFMCNGTPAVPVPIVQAGENILYSMEPDGSLEMHVQIVYTGRVDTFAWILPVPYVPEFELGSDAVFTTLAAQTEPAFRVTTARVEGTCRDAPSCPPPVPPQPCVRCPRDGGSFADAGAAPPSVDVAFRGTVGPFETVVLQSGTAEELLSWLRANGYDIPDISIPIIESYVAARQYFVALKLRADVTSAGEIQPIVLRFRNAKPCLPIRLTAIATTPNLPITAYFLGSARAAPRNYSLAEPNYELPSLYQYTVGGFIGAPSPFLQQQYRAYVDAEIDRLGGQAFVTEYAGATPGGRLDVPNLSSALMQTDIQGFVNAVVRALPRPVPPGTPPAPPWLGAWSLPDPQVVGILQRALGAEQIMCPNFINQSCFVVGAQNPLDARAVLDELDRLVLAPRRRINALLARQPKLTRLYTSMSAADMTLDPEFDADPLLDDVSNVHTASSITLCSPEYITGSAPSAMEFPSGRRVTTGEGRRFENDAAYCAAIGRPYPPPGSAVVQPPTGPSLPVPETRLPRLADGGAVLPSSAFRGGGCSAAHAGATGFGTLAAGILAAFWLARRRARSASNA